MLARTPLSWHLDTSESATVLTVRGLLDEESGRCLRRAAVQCLAQQPATLILDLSRMTASPAAPASVFTAIAHRAHCWPGTTVAFCAPPSARVVLPHSSPAGPSTVFASLADARTALDSEAPPPPPIRAEFGLASGAARCARDITTEACVRWGLTHLVGRCARVADEMVVNAELHARTGMTLQVRLGRHHLYVAVSDGAPAGPVLRHGGRPGDAAGHGLLLIAAMSDLWGCRTRPDGKVVWAALARSR